MDLPPDAVIVPATAEHAAALALELRSGELAELEAQGFESPLDALRAGLRMSDECCSALYRGRVVAMFGIGRDASGPTSTLGGDWVGSLWFLTGEGFPLAARHFMKPARALVALMLERHLVLATVIDARYDAALRWARWLGFEILAARPYGPAGLPFHPALLRRPS